MDTQIELAPGRPGDGDGRTPDVPPPCVIRLWGSLSEQGVADVVPRLEELLTTHGTVVADVSGLALVDASAVHALEDALTNAGEWPDVRLALAAPDAALSAALAATGVGARVTVHPDVDIALAHLDDRPALTYAFWHFTVTPRAPAIARGHVRRVCRRWGVDDEVREAAEIVVTELVTNAVEHGESASVVHAQRSDAAFRLTVRDFDPAPLPETTLPDPTSIRGRGLAMVAAVARAWGVEPHDDGKSVWAELPTP